MPKPPRNPPPGPHKEPEKALPLAVIHNELARATYDQALSSLCLRLIVMLAEKIGYADNELLSHRFKVTDYAEKLGLNNRGGYLYEQFSEAATRLLKTLVTTQKTFGGEKTQFQVMSLARYDKQRGEIELHFHQEMRPLLLNLREYFSRIPLEVFFRIRSVYAARLYLYCKSWDPTDDRNRNPGWSWTVEEFRHWMALEPGQYGHTPHLRAAIIERAKQELDEVADLSFVYTANKEGKTITGWNFTPVANKPSPKLKATRQAKGKRLPEPAPEPGPVANFDEEARVWLSASEEQRRAWFGAPEFIAYKYPKEGARPGNLFLTVLRNVLQKTAQSAAA
jgi:hypothetical protein